MALKNIRIHKNVIRSILTTETKETDMTLKLLTLLCAATVLAACSSSMTKNEQSMDLAPYVYIPKRPVGVACIDHTSTYVSNYYVYEPIQNRRSGGTNCGGLNAAGYMLPKTWYPGMKVKVTWKLSGQDKWREVTTNIMRYEKADNVFVHIFDNDQVRVVSSVPFPGSTEHPIVQGSKIPPPEEL